MVRNIVIGVIVALVVCGEALGPPAMMSARSHLLAAHVAEDGVPLAFVQFDDDGERPDWVECWRVDTGAYVATMPSSWRTIFDDSGRSMMALAEPDGSQARTPEGPLASAALPAPAAATKRGRLTRAAGTHGHAQIDIHELTRPSEMVVRTANTQVNCMITTYGGRYWV